MKHIIFFSTPALGHILAEEPIIRALVQRGYHIDWYSSEKYRSIIEQSGASFVPYKQDFDALYDLSSVTEDFYKLMETILGTGRECFMDYNDQITASRPDLIIYDSMCLFAKNLANTHNIKSVCLCSTLAYNNLTVIFSNMFLPTIKLAITHGPALIKMIMEEKAFRRKNSIHRLKLIDLFVNSGDITLVLSPREFQPFCRTFPKSYKFIGTTIKDKHSVVSCEEQECDVFVSLGSILTEDEALLKSIATADCFRGKLITINAGQAKMDGLPKTVKLRHQVNQVAILQKCGLFIGHGGINSVYEGIYYGVPQICIPKQEEQRMNAKILAKKHIGVCIRDFDPNKISKYIQKLDKNSKNLIKYQKILRSLDGTKNAVIEIEKLLG